MKIFRELSKYLGIFILAVAVIAVYKTFDNIGVIFSWIGRIISLLKPFIIGIVVAYVLITPCRFAERLLKKSRFKFVVGHSRGIAVAFIYLLFAAAVVLLFSALVPALITNIVDFYNYLPTLISDLVTWFNSLDLGYTIGEVTIEQILNNDIFSIDKLFTVVNMNNVNKYAQSVISAGSGLFSVFMGLVVSIYVLLDRDSLKNSSKRLFRIVFKGKGRFYVAKYLRRVNEYANKYIYCMLVDALIIFILSFIIMSIEGVKYAPLLALMTGLLNLIPYFGAITATVVTCIITVFTGSLTKGIVVLVSLLVLQQLDSNLIQPHLLSGSLKVKPYWVIVGIFVGGGLFGIVGIFLAVPVTALCRSILIDIMDYSEEKEEALRLCGTEATDADDNKINNKNKKDRSER